MPIGNLPEYRVVRVEKDFSLPAEAAFWGAFPALKVDHYLWLGNGYEPRVDVRLCYSARYLYVRFDVFEAKVRVRFTHFQDPVYKDSCVEMFINPFPDRGIGYVNVEMNAAGTALVAIGPDRGRRIPMAESDLAGWEVVPSLRGPISGFHGAELWTLTYRLPLLFFENCYGAKIGPGQTARANFYKCGEETETPHFGAWSPVLTAQPDFHRPEFFGRLAF
jgi:hypothetical protein